MFISEISFAEINDSITCLEILFIIFFTFKNGDSSGHFEFLLITFRMNNYVTPYDLRPPVDGGCVCAPCHAGSGLPPPATRYFRGRLRWLHYWKTSE